MPRKRRFKPSRKPTPAATAVRSDDGALPPVNSAAHHDAPRADASLPDAPPVSTPSA